MGRIPKRTQYRKGSHSDRLDFPKSRKKKHIGLFGSSNRVHTARSRTPVDSSSSYSVHVSPREDESEKEVPMVNNVVF